VVALFGLLFREGGGVAGEAVIVVRGLVKEHGSAVKVQALRGLDLTVHAGELVAVMGASGSGKSTLLHLLAGLDRPTAGSIVLEGRDLARLSEDERALLRRSRLGLVFQGFHLLQTLTAEENVLLPLAIAGRAGAEGRRRAAEALACVGLARRRGHRPDQLSGGEQQRVAIARALVIDPVVLLADEPTGNLDSGAGARIMDLLCWLVDERGETLLMVTHDQSHAARADRVLRLHDGRLLPDAAPAPPPVAPAAARAWAAWTHEEAATGRRHAALLVPGAAGPPPVVVLVQPCTGGPQPPPAARAA
jgi:putative ABC transport system ATP-binding protein